MTGYCARCRRVVDVTVSTVTVKCTICGRQWPNRPRRRAS